MVIVSRYLKSAKSEDDDFFTRMGNRVFTTMVNFLFKSNYTDALVIFRAFRKDILNKMEFNKNEDIDLQLSIYCAKKRLKVTEIPGDEPPRIGGERKMKVIKTGALILHQIIKGWFIR